MSRGWVGFDLDATLAHYDHWRGETHIGAPIPKMVDRLQRHLAAGDEVRIMTARIYPLTYVGPAEDRTLFVGATDRECQANVAAVAILEWCEKHLGRRLPITSQKDYSMLCFYDDRCRQVVPNSGDLVEDLPR